MSISLYTISQIENFSLKQLICSVNSESLKTSSRRISSERALLLTLYFSLFDIYLEAAVILSCNVINLSPLNNLK